VRGLGNRLTLNGVEKSGQQVHHGAVIAPDLSKFNEEDAELLRWALKHGWHWVESIRLLYQNAIYGQVLWTDELTPLHRERIRAYRAYVESLPPFETSSV
jgi:hypothetical protein